MLLTGEYRKRAQRGDLPLTQLESQLGQPIPQDRSLNNSKAEIEILRSERDDDVIETIEARSVGLSEICERARGEEMSKAGMRWKCPSCLQSTVPGKKLKGGSYQSKNCPNCGLELRTDNVSTNYLVTIEKPPGDSAPFMDGDDLTRRYKKVAPSKWITLDDSDWKYKKPDTYAGSKILIRQAGVGLLATYDETGAYCPQSMYIYRTNPGAGEYDNRFVLAALLSRTMTYYVFKRYGEVDPDRAHAKMTHTRLEQLPIPKIDFADPKQRKKHDRIVDLVDKILSGQAEIGSAEDLEIEQLLRELWGISADDGAYINAEFFRMPSGQVVRDLFPEGPPKPTSKVIHLHPGVSPPS